MASLERRNSTYRVVFMYAGKKLGYSLDTADRPTAEALKGGVEKTLMLIGQGVLTVPPGADPVEFVRSGGKATEQPQPPPEPLTFAALRDRYLDAHRHGAMEASSLATLEVHFRHLGASFGERFIVGRVRLADLQEHVDRRLRMRFRGRPVSPVTVRKDVTTLRTAWNWAALRGLVTGPFPGRGLVYPKTDEKPPFLTLGELERRAAVGLTEEERDALAESLYLRREEIDGLLAHVRATAAHPWLYPLVCTAAHTGARRSELVRIEVADVDLTAGTLLVREKKRSKRQRTTRHVSLSPFLAGVLRDWLAVHPGGRYLFCQSGVVAHSSKRSATTGYRSGDRRPTTNSGRKATVTRRPAVGVAPLTKDEAYGHLRRTLAGTRWEPVRGYHVLRHSFISCLAAGGVDQRIIDEFVGHQTDEQRKRYRHLIPEVKRQAVASVFG